MIELLGLLVVGWFVLVVVLGGGIKMVEGVASLAGNAWRKVDHKETVRRAHAQEYLRSHPDAIRATWRREWD